MSAKTSDFPFTIMDVIAILHLNIRRKSPDYVYTDCPLCGSRRGKLCANLVKNTWYSNCCGESGGKSTLRRRIIVPWGCFSPERFTGK